MAESEVAAGGMARLQNLHLKDEANRPIKEAITALQFKLGNPVKPRTNNLKKHA